MGPTMTKKCISVLDLSQSRTTCDVRLEAVLDLQGRYSFFTIDIYIFKKKIVSSIKICTFNGL